MKSFIASETRNLSAARASALVANTMMPIAGAVELQDADGPFGTHFTTAEEVVCDGESHLIKKIVVELHGTKLDVPVPPPVQESKHCPGCHYVEAPRPMTLTPPETTWKTMAGQPVIVQRPSIEAQPIAQPIPGFTIETLVSELQPTAVIPSQQIQFQPMAPPQEVPKPPQVMQQFATIPVSVTVPVQGLNQFVQPGAAQQFIIPQSQGFIPQQYVNGDAAAAAYSQQFVMDRLYSLINKVPAGEVAFGGRPATLAEYLTATLPTEALRKEQQFVIANFDALRAAYVDSIRPHVANMHELGTLVNEAAFYQWLIGMPLTPATRERILTEAKNNELALLNQAADRFITHPVKPEEVVPATPSDMTTTAADENDDDYEEEDYFADEDEVANSEIDSLFV